MMTRNTLPRLAFAALVLTLAASGCKPWRVFTVADYAGKWKLQPEGSPALLARMGRVPIDSHIVLSADGSFTALEMPLEEFPDRKPFRLRSGKGTWQIMAHSNRAIEVRFADKDSEVLHVEVGADDEPLIVHEVGGPESDERWVWKKARD